MENRRVGELLTLAFLCIGLGTWGIMIAQIVNAPYISGLVSGICIAIGLICLVDLNKA